MKLVKQEKGAISRKARKTAQGLREIETSKDISLLDVPREEQFNIFQCASQVFPLTKETLRKIINSRMNIVMCGSPLEINKILNEMFLYISAHERVLILGEKPEIDINRQPDSIYFKQMSVLEAIKLLPDRVLITSNPDKLDIQTVLVMMDITPCGTVVSLSVDNVVDTNSYNIEPYFFKYFMPRIGGYINLFGKIKKICIYNNSH